MKSAQIRSFFWSLFPRIRTEYGDSPGKYGPEKTPYLDTFHALSLTLPPLMKFFNKKEYEKSYSFLHSYQGLSHLTPWRVFLAGIYVLKVNKICSYFNISSNKNFKICSKLTVKTPGRSHWRRSGVCVINFQHTPHLVLVLLFFYRAGKCRLGMKLQKRRKILKNYSKSV